MNNYIKELVNEGKETLPVNSHLRKPYYEMSDGLGAMEDVTNNIPKLNKIVRQMQKLQDRLEKEMNKMFLWD